MYNDWHVPLYRGQKDVVSKRLLFYYCGSKDQPGFKSIEGLIECLVIPFKGYQLIGVINLSKGIEQVGAEVGIDVGG